MIQTQTQTQIEFMIQGMKISS